MIKKNHSADSEKISKENVKKIEAEEDSVKKRNVKKD